MEALLTNCRRYGITISKRKFRMAEEVSFAGYTVNNKGISPDPKRVEAMREFPTPQDLTGVRSFLGLVNQLGQFIPDLAMQTEKIRHLLKKGVMFLWLPEHQREYEQVKDILCAPHRVHFFDPNLSTSCLLYTSDAADE